MTRNPVSSLLDSCREPNPEKKKSKQSQHREFKPKPEKKQSKQSFRRILPIDRESCELSAGFLQRAQTLRKNQNSLNTENSSQNREKKQSKQSFKRILPIDQGSC